MQLLTYQIYQKVDGTYYCRYIYVDDKGKLIGYEAPKVQLDYKMQPLVNREEIMFPNIKGHCIMDLELEEKKENTSILFSDSELREGQKAANHVFAVAVLAEIKECAKQEDCLVYKGDKEVDSFVRLSDVEKAINKYLNESIR